MNNSFSKETSERIKALINKDWGIGRIFNYLRKKKSHERTSNLGLLRSILYTFNKIGKLPSVKKINYHFRTKIPKDEYAGSKKWEILKDLHDPR